MKALFKIFTVIIGVAVVALAAFIMTFDANKYRPQIAEALSTQAGRTVKLEGPVKLSLSLTHGFQLNLKDVSIANPPWASRPVMARIGGLALGVSLPPLLQHKIDVTSFNVSDSDIQLESNAAGQNNWQLESKSKESGVTPATPPCTGKDCAKEAGAAPAFHVNEVTIKNSRFAMRDKNGKMSVFKVADLTFVPKGRGMSLKLTGEANGTPVSLDLEGEKSLESIMNVAWPFDAEGHYANLNLKIKGVLNAPSKQFADTYEISSGDSKITGQIAVGYGSARPDIKGTVSSDKLNPSDFKIASAENKEQPKGEEKVGSPSESSGRIFSTEPLDLSGLKAVDASLDVKIADLVVGPSGLKDVQTKLDLTNGRLLLSPFKAMVDGKAIEGQIKVDAESKPIQVAALLKAYQIDLAQLVRLGGLSSFIESKGDADMDITTSGNSMHELASNANGQINLVMAGGTVSTQEAGNIASDLLNVFAPGTGGLAKPGLNCMVAHLKITNGIVKTDGVLLDSSQATVLGTGDINLRDETINMLLRARSKGVDVSAYTPPLRVSGPLSHPGYKPDAAGTIEKVVGLIQNGKASESGVPDVVQQAGQNACEYTLQHPQPGQSAQSPTTVEGVVDKAKTKLEDAGGKLLKGLGGMFGK